MDVEPSMASIGALIGSPARAGMLAALFDGQAMTATELAQIANVAPATASEHLAKLTAARLLLCEAHGRHRYYRIAGPEVAEALEPLVHLTPMPPVPLRVPSPEVEAMRRARLCYDHLAGALGVQMTEAMISRGFLAPRDRDFDLTESGSGFCHGLGVDVDAARRKRRVFARQCLDWSERKPHLAGALGAAIAEATFASGWIERTERRREVRVTRTGAAALAEHLGLSAWGRA